ncbi:MAG: hypothetical protein M1834_003304 [Cirrosporium novae-zelandiae]|nr:MAG: hypothetical protein M1834_003304 [Cirrosporium novae-zelandiae]
MLIIAYSLSNINHCSSLTIFSSRTTNPTYTPTALPPLDYTWGCPPGTLCAPEQNGHNFESGPPASTYYCSPEECIATPPLLPNQYWGDPVTTNTTGIFVVSPYYFNLDPTDFDGLDYSIFRELVGALPSSTPSATPRLLEIKDRDLFRRDSGEIPGSCYPICNDCQLEAQSTGKTAKLCESGSAFNIDLSQCQACIQYHEDNLVVYHNVLEPQFGIYLDYCSVHDVASQVTSIITSTLANGSPTVVSTVIPVSAPGRPASVTSIITSTLANGSPTIITSVIAASTTSVFTSTLANGSPTVVNTVMPASATSVFTSTLSNGSLTVISTMVPVVPSSKASSTTKAYTFTLPNGRTTVLTAEVPASTSSTMSQATVTANNTVTITSSTPTAVPASTGCALSPRALGLICTCTMIFMVLFT